jgi:hypothetical protein
MKTNLFVAILSVIVLSLNSCQKDNDLSRSVYVSDPENPDLPAYSEWGYNTFGAYYDRAAFISSSSEVPVKVVVNDSATSFVFAGYKGYGSSKMAMTFEISGLLPNSYRDLILLNDTVFNLLKPTIHVSISEGLTTVPVTILEGQLNFKRAQNLFVDKVQKEVILSGYFNFKAIINNVPVTISDGRFDVGVENDNFYKL